MLNKYITDKAKTWKDTFETTLKRDLDYIWESLLAKYDQFEYWNKPMGHQDMRRLIWLCDMVESLATGKVVEVNEGLTLGSQLQLKCYEEMSEMSCKSYINKIRFTYVVDAVNASLMVWRTESAERIVDSFKTEILSAIKTPVGRFKPALSFGDIIILFMVYADRSVLSRCLVSSTMSSLELIQFMYTYLIDVVNDEPALKETIVKSYNIFQVQKMFLSWNSFLLEKPLIML